MRIAQTRGGKRVWIGWLESTKGCEEKWELGCCCDMVLDGVCGCFTYEEERPDGVVEEDGAGED